MNTYDKKEFDLWVSQASARYILQTHGRRDFVRDILEGGCWKELRYRRTPEHMFQLSAYRFDFGVSPGLFWKLMENGRVVALFCRESAGDPVISSHPFASYKQTCGKKSRYACLYVLDEVAPLMGREEA